MLPGVAPLPILFPAVGAVPAQQQEAQRPRIVSGEATLEADSITYDPVTGTTVLNGNVLATYGPTRLTCATATLNSETKEAHFRTGIVVTDPVGTLEARELWVDFDKPGSARAVGITLQAHEAYFEGEELLIEPNEWRLRNAWATTCRSEAGKPEYRVLLTDIVFKPGDAILAKKSGFEVLGMRVDVPFFRVGLDQSQTGLQTPTPTINSGFEPGYRWRNVFDVGPSAAFLYEQEAGTRDVPTVNAQLAFTTRKRSPTERERMIVVRNYDRERFSEGFVNNVMVSTPQAEEAAVGRGEMIFFVGHTSNQGVQARLPETNRFDRDWYGGVEVAGRVAGLIANGQARYGHIQDRNSGVETRRAEGFVTFLTDLVPVSRNLYGRGRFDIGAYWGGGKDYGWLRPEMSLIYEPRPETRFTAAYVNASSWGSPFTDADRLVAPHAIHLRLDLDFPATDLSILAKYDIERSVWYDFEVALGQVAHCIRPFIAYRKFPGTLAFGATLRADKLFDALKQREVRR
ncbi:MAG: hypothetical protein D6724_00145 [Armatimonadetes bacterium]|nr:MAG: hypothetical protein D6724_00145 [Armatimonadota bacterium]